MEHMEREARRLRLRDEVSDETNVSSGVTLDMKIEETKRVFAKTTTYTRAKKVLKREGHVTLSGASGEGKTTLALMLGEKSKRCGYELVFVNDIGKFKLDDYLRMGKNLLFVFDDIFGTVGLSTDVPQLRRILHELKLCLEAKTSRKQIHEQSRVPRVRVIFTTKTYNLECGMSKLDGQEFFFFKGPTLIDLTKMKTYQYTFEEKKKIFQKHKHNHDEITVNFEDVYDAEQSIFGFPLTCQLFFEFHAFQTNPKEFFQKPLFYLRRELQKLLQERDEKSAALALMLICDGKLDLTHVETEFKNTSLERLFRSVRSMLPCITGIDVAAAARNFRGTFFTGGDIIGFSHPTIYDACACALYQIAPMFVLENCSVKFLYERLKESSVDATSVGDHFHYIYVSDAYRGIIAKRIAQAIEEGNFRMSVTHPILENEGLVDTVFQMLDLQSVLSLTDSTGNNLLHHASTTPNTYVLAKVLPLYDINNRGQNGWTPVMMAAHSGQMDAFDLIVSKGADLNLVDASGDNVLHLASEGGNTRIVEKLLPLFGINFRGENGCTPVMIAAHCGNKGVLNLLISNGADLNLTDDFGENIVNLACKAGNTSIVTQLITLLGINIRGEHGRTPVMAAVVSGQSSVFDLLLLNGADLTLTDNNGDSVFHLASQASNDCIVEKLLKSFNINARGQNGWTPVMMAANSGQNDIFDLLVSNGANLTLSDDHGDNALHHACKAGNIYIVKQLLSSIDINIRGHNGKTPVMSAAQNGQGDVVDLLASMGAELGLRDNYDNNAIHRAIKKGCSADMVQKLLPSFDINNRGHKGRTLVMRAALNGQKDVFDMLVSNGSVLTMTDNDGDSVLHHAVNGANNDIIEQLLSLLDINIRGRDGLTPVMTAVLEGRKDVFDCLVLNGADLTLVDNNGNNLVHHAIKGGEPLMTNHIVALFEQ